MGEKANAFAAGGCGCLTVFAVFAGLALLVGGRAHINIGGAVLLFVCGGFVGLLVLWIYNKGKRDRSGP